MSRADKVWILLVCMFALSACSMFGRPDYRSLLTTCSDDQPRMAQQQWHINTSGRVTVFNVMVERYPDGWQWVMLDGLGQRIATVIAQDGDVTVQKQKFKDLPVPLMQLLQTWQYIYWPIEDLVAFDSKSSFYEYDQIRKVMNSGIVRTQIKYTLTNETREKKPVGSVWGEQIEVETDFFTLTIQSQPY